MFVQQQGSHQERCTKDEPRIPIRETHGTLVLGGENDREYFRTTQLEVTLDPTWYSPTKVTHSSQSGMK